MGFGRLFLSVFSDEKLELVQSVELSDNFETSVYSQGNLTSYNDKLFIVYSEVNEDENIRNIILKQFKINY